ncbi:MAG: acyl-CoA thioesterase [Rhodobacteraceae bacterium]|nr:acyl-CoA thioesterase [Paracoccaceae bacterium]
MYPIVRMVKELALHARSAPLPPDGTHVSYHLCWPWDLDVWMELNNGRTLTLFDLGRIPMAMRMGLTRVLREKRWGITVAGSSVRYRRRVRLFDRVEMRSRVLGWDERFLYVEQTMWRSNGACANQILLRNAITGPNGIVPTADVAAALGISAESPELPGWVKAWIDADAERPWPPERA